MGNKNRHKKKGEIKVETETETPATPVNLDTQWKISRLNADPNRLGRYIKRFMEYEQSHPEWVEDMMGGMPTYYFILGVSHDATKAEISDAITRRMQFQIFPEEVFKNALRVFITPGEQKKYDNFLSVFEQISKVMPPEDKKELIETHDQNVSNTVNLLKIEEIKEEYSNFFIMYLEGMPDIYEIAGLEKESDIDTIKSKCRRDSELMQKIYSVLTDPVSRDRYDTMLNYAHIGLMAEVLESRAKKTAHWKSYDQETLERIILLTLTESEGISNYILKFGTIIDANPDWMTYLPPSEETFLTILGIEPELLKADKKEVEGILRNKYRGLDRTPKVNLAYSALKNQTLRENYMWCYENREFVEIVKPLLVINDN